MPTGYTAVERCNESNMGWRFYLSLQQNKLNKINYKQNKLNKLWKKKKFFKKKELEDRINEIDYEISKEKDWKRVSDLTIHRLNLLNKKYKNIISKILKN